MNKLSRSLPPLRSLLAFEAAARRGSFTAAATELNVSQPAISRQVKALEDSLGIHVFKREHRCVTLTDEGKKYYDAVASGLQGIAEAGQSLGRTTAPERLTIYANYGLASYWLMPRLTRFQDANPDTEIVVRTVEQEQHFSGIEPEIAIRFGNGNWTDGDVRMLFKEIGFPLCSPEYLKGKPPLSTVEDLQHHKLLKIQTDEQSWLDWTGFLQAYGLKLGNSAGPTYNNYTLAIQAALAGQGIAIGWDRIVDDYVRRGWLVRPISDEVATEFGYYSVTNRAMSWSEKFSDVLEWLHRQVLPAEFSSENVS